MLPIEKQAVGANAKFVARLLQRAAGATPIDPKGLARHVSKTLSARSGLPGVVSPAASQASVEAINPLVIKRLGGTNLQARVSAPDRASVLERLLGKRGDRLVPAAPGSPASIAYVAAKREAAMRDTVAFDKLFSNMRPLSLKGLVDSRPVAEGWLNDVTQAHQAAAAAAAAAVSRSRPTVLQHILAKIPYFGQQAARHVRVGAAVKYRADSRVSRAAGAVDIRQSGLRRHDRDIQDNLEGVIEALRTGNRRVYRDAKLPGVLEAVEAAMRARPGDARVIPAFKDVLNNFHPSVRTVPLPRQLHPHTGLHANTPTMQLPKIQSLDELAPVDASQLWRGYGAAAPQSFMPGRQIEAGQPTWFSGHPEVAGGYGIREPQLARLAQLPAASVAKHGPLGPFTGHVMQDTRHVSEAAIPPPRAGGKAWDDSPHYERVGTHPATPEKLLEGANIWKPLPGQDRTWYRAVHGMKGLPGQ